MGLCASAAAGSGPELPGISAPLINLDGTSQAAVLIARSCSTVARVPIKLVDLEDTDIEGTVGVVVHGLLVSTALVGDDAVAALLVPGISAADRANVNTVRSRSAWAARAAGTGAVATASVSGDGDNNERKEDEDFHRINSE